MDRKNNHQFSNEEFIKRPEGRGTSSFLADQGSKDKNLRVSFPNMSSEKNEENNDKCVLVLRMTPVNRLVMLRTFDEVLDWLKASTSSSCNRKFMIQSASDLSGENVYDVMLLPEDDCTNTLMNKLNSLYNVVDKITNEVANKVTKIIDDIEVMMDSEARKREEKRKKAAVTIQQTWRNHVEKKKLIVNTLEEERLRAVEEAEKERQIEKERQKQLQLEREAIEWEMKQMERFSRERQIQVRDPKVQTIMDMGFENWSEQQILEKLEKCKGSIEMTVELLLQEDSQ